MKAECAAQQLVMERQILGHWGKVQVGHVSAGAGACSKAGCPCSDSISDIVTDTSMMQQQVAVR